MVKIPEPRRANAIRFPSGENAGSTADLPPFVICCTPAPFVWMRISWIGPGLLFGCAENTIQRGAGAAPEAACAATTTTASAQRRRSEDRPAARNHRVKKYHNDRYDREDAPGEQHDAADGERDPGEHAVEAPRPRRPRARRPRQRRQRPGSGRAASAERRDPLEQELEERVRVDLDSDLRVRRTVGPAPAVDDGAAAVQLRLQLDLDVEVLGADDPGPEGVRERDRVVDRGAVPAVGALVVLLEELDQLRDERADRGPRRGTAPPTRASGARRA